MTAWEALYGRRPFPEQSPLARLEAIERGAIVMPGRPHVRASIKRVLREGLAAAPEQRPPLRLLLRRFEASASPRRWWLVPLVVVALAAVGLAYRLGVHAPPAPLAAVLVEEPCEPPADELASRWAADV